MVRENILSKAKKVVSIERKALANLEKKFNNTQFSKEFAKAVDILFNCKGKIVVSGIGKSGIIAQKIVATFNSTGAPSIFMHSADSIHGDLGVLKEDDVVLLISKSGATNEVKQLISIFRDFKIKVISIVGNLNSQLAKYSDAAIDSSVKEEACPHNLAPTSSTTVSLVIGDALAVTLLQLRGFSKEDFAVFHPGGQLGKKLLLKVNDLMAKDKDIPAVNADAEISDIVYEIGRKRLGCTCVIKHKKLLGIITDGDIRRYLGSNPDLSGITAKKIMNKKPKLINKEALAVRALEEMETNKITQLVVTDKQKNIEGIIHMHKLVEMGL